MKNIIYISVSILIVFTVSLSYVYHYCSTYSFADDIAGNYLTAVQSVSYSTAVDKKIIAENGISSDLVFNNRVKYYRKFIHIYPVSATLVNISTYAANDKKENYDYQFKQIQIKANIKDVFSYLFLNKPILLEFYRNDNKIGTLAKEKNNNDYAYIQMNTPVKNNDRYLSFSAVGENITNSFEKYDDQSKSYAYWKDVVNSSIDNQLNNDKQNREKRFKNVSNTIAYYRNK